MSIQQTPFKPNKYYHIYNHGNGEDNIFRSDSNYLYFLKKYAEYLNPISETYAYCLMPNHFHFLIRIKSEEELLKYFKGMRAAIGKNLQGLEDLEGLVSQQYSNFFNAYVKAFNKQQDRRGSLFTVNLKRKEVKNDSYFSQLIHYIHYNPVHHNFVTSIDNWTYSSYHSLVSEKQTRLDRKSVLEWFGGKEDFKKFHNQKPEPKIFLEMDY